MTLKQGVGAQIEPKVDYKKSLKETSDEALVQIFLDSYLERDFPTTFERWMAETDVQELKRRLIHYGML